MRSSCAIVGKTSIQQVQLGLNVFSIAMTVDQRHSMKLASVWFVFANVPLSAQSSEFLSFDVRLLFHGNLCSSYLLSSYTKKKQYLELKRMKSKEARIVAEASANDLLDNATRVCTMMAEESFEFYLKQEEDGKLSKYIHDVCIQKKSASKR
jgi:hypothetical protein